MRINMNSSNTRAATACAAARAAVLAAAFAATFSAAFTTPRAEAADVFPSSLGNCIAGLESEGDFGVRICEARAARALMTPGAGKPCATSARLIRGRLLCTKNDLASSSASARPTFRPFPIGIDAPITVGDFDRFYGGRSAGAGGRFHVARHNGDLRIEERTSGARREAKCTFNEDTFSCVKESGGGIYQSHTVSSYVLRLDGLEVTEDHRPWTCLRSEYCNVCGNYLCRHYGLGAVQKTLSFHPWN